MKSFTQCLVHGESTRRTAFSELHHHNDEPLTQPISSPLFLGRQASLPSCQPRDMGIAAPVPGEVLFLSLDPVGPNSVLGLVSDGKGWKEQ